MASRTVEAIFQFRVLFNPETWGGGDFNTAREACFAFLRDGERWDWETITDRGERLALIDAHFEGERPEDDARDALIALLPFAVVTSPAMRRSR